MPLRSDGGDELISALTVLDPTIGSPGVSHATVWGCTAASRSNSFG